MVGAAIDSDDTYMEALRTLHEAQAKARLLSDMRELFRHRKDLLVQEALQLRMEGGSGDPVIAFDARRRQSALSALEKRAVTLGDAAGLTSPANGDGDRRPSRTPVK
jgi:hypothetical protein